MCCRRQQGFSLLELLVTLFVIVMVTSLVTLNIGSGDRDILLKAAVEGLADSANYALDEAQFTGINHGLRLRMEDESGEWRYHADWYAEGQTGWRTPDDGREVFASSTLPVGLEIQLEIDGVIQEAESLVPVSENPTPQVVFYSSGETVPGIMDIRDAQTGELLWRMEWDLLGNFRLLRRGQLDDEVLP